MAPAVAKFATEGWVTQLGNILEERFLRIRSLIDEDRAVTRDELARFVWGTGRSVRQAIKPDDKEDAKRRQAWMEAKGMLKELIDWEKFSPQQYFEPCVKNVLEKRVAEVIENYRIYVLTGEIRTKHFPPKLLGETDEIVCVDKPCQYTCTYGGSKDDTSAPPRQKATSASQLLNGEKAEIQIHEYLALKFHYETAVGTREWWATGEEQISCWCGKCPYCACTQSGCCNRLDRETSGVMVAAKTKHGFGEIRAQFSSVHSLETGGTEKYYFALCHGNVQLPKETEEKSKHWKHGITDGRGRVEVAMRFDKEVRRSLAWDSGDGPPQDIPANQSQYALTFYDPVAWFTGPKKEIFTLVHVQIITGRTHQIRFHLAEVGHPLAGDPTYGAPHSDRKWCGRVFLHSYQTKFREPFTFRWFEACSPLPPDLGQILVGLQLDVVKEGLSAPYLSRRDHPPLYKIMKQYDPMKPLLFSHDPPVSAEALTAAKKQIKFAADLNQPGAQDKGKWAGKDSWSQGGGATGPAASQENGSGGDAGSWQNGGSSWSGGWKSNDSWKQDSWKSGDWKKDNWQGGDWKNESNGQKGQGAAAKAQSQNKGNDDDDDAWGGWSAPAQTDQKEQQQQQQQPPQQEQQAWQAPQQQMPPQGHPPGEPPWKKPRIEVPAHVAQQAPSTPPKALAFMQGQVQRPPSFRRMESRSQPGVYYYFNEATNETRVEPPPPWEKKESRSQAGVFYYWNTVTCETSVVKPEV